MDDASHQGANPALLRESLTRRLHRRSVVNGKITIPAVPAMLGEYLDMCTTIFAAVGRGFSPEQLEHLREVLKRQLEAAFEASPRSNIVITYNAPVGMVLNYTIETQWWTVEGAYERWIATRKPPLFGTQPDARVWDLATDADDPASHPVLDIGAGTGRNALALAKRGHPVDAVEMTPKFAELIRLESTWESLNIRVLQCDVFSAADDLRQDYQLMLLSEVVSDFRTTQQLRNMCEIAAKCLAPGGRVVFNIFLAQSGYQPDDAARELSQQCYSNIFTREEMYAAAAGLPLEFVSDDSVYEYEMAHLPEGAWPPTSWYPEWVSGQDVFDVGREQCPIDMRWLVYGKTR